MQLRTADIAHRLDHDWVALGTSVVGTSHLARQAPCQDAHGGVVLGDGSLVLVVADGAGSARYAEDGSRLAVAAAIASMANTLHGHPPCSEGSWRACLLEALQAAQESLAGQAEQVEDSSIRDFATTLLLVVITTKVVASLQVGDGAVVLKTDEALELLAPARTGEYVNETTFITSENAVQKALVSLRVVADVQAIALFTDGVEFLAIEQATQSAYAPFFQPLFDFTEAEDAEAEQIEAMLSSDRVNQLTDDDKTLVVAVRRRAGC